MMSPFIQNIITNFEWNVYSNDMASHPFSRSTSFRAIHATTFYICQRMYSRHREIISLFPPIVYWKGKIIAYKWIEARDQMNRDEHERIYLRYKCSGRFFDYITYHCKHTTKHTHIRLVVRWWNSDKCPHKKWETVNKLWHFIFIEIYKQYHATFSYSLCLSLSWFNRKCILALEQCHKTLCIFEIHSTVGQVIKTKEAEKSERARERARS